MGHHVRIETFLSDEISDTVEQGQILSRVFSTEASAAAEGIAKLPRCPSQSLEAPSIAGRVAADQLC